ncbi:hypothetical protein QVD17_03273 [Tagetes erecta]|uniref:Wall-associated receptor kinase galacturonan-binding domain-containing protein n=1 Tax=Tagetes erecta TaxID=13708 RepID=A0AAD8L9P2_TARER|nr:hypothetical protein QVD17_03273 [Tagetes erecta]
MQLLVLVFWFCLTITIIATAAATTNTNNIAKPGCQTKCGNVTISYPFGIGPNCSINPWFDITCNTSFSPPKPFYGSRELYNVTNSTFRMGNTVASRCYDQYGNITENIFAYTKMGNESPFTFSPLNKFTLISCSDLTIFSDPDQFTTGCLSLCSSPDDVIGDGSCSGGGCCQTSVVKGLKYYFTMTMSRTYGRDRSAIWKFNPCTYSFMGEPERFTFRGASDLIDPNFKTRVMATVPILMDWVR